ncbi:MAG TPA: hypothetical protein VEC36_04955 [Patescibacteria group bacterium]|nr:hypothetical protein [Patescibacteria group bacterium]
MNAKHKFQFRALQLILPLLTIVMIAGVTWEYFSSKSLSDKGELAPFSQGLFKNQITGRIGKIKINRGKAIIFLHTNGFKSNTEIEFNPNENGFFNNVQPNDSLWKFANTNIIYTIGKDSVKYKWSFLTRDRYGRKYAE